MRGGRNPSAAMRTARGCNGSHHARDRFVTVRLAIEIVYPPRFPSFLRSARRSDSPIIISSSNVRTSVLNLCTILPSDIPAAKSSLIYTRSGASSSYSIHIHVTTASSCQERSSESSPFLFTLRAARLIDDFCSTSFLSPSSSSSYPTSSRECKVFRHPRTTDLHLLPSQCS